MKFSELSYFRPLALASLSASLLLACGGMEGDESAATGLETSHEALTVNGMTVNWQKVGYPWAANKIAACGGDVIYALNNDYTLWKGNGTDSGWTYRGNPYAARDIACTSSTWIWAINSDKTFYYNVYSGDDSKWVYEGTAGSAEQIGNGTMLTALNFDDRVYTYDNATKVWTYKALFSGATEASSAGSRWFVVVGGSVNFTSGSSLALTAFPIVVNGVTQTVRDVSAPSSDLVWALTENRELYKAVFKEVACQDGADNDGDSRADGYDSDCYAPLGATLCSQFAQSGSYCISRLGVASNALAVCNGSTLVSTSAGDWCNQVGSGGSDYLGWLQ